MVDSGSDSKISTGRLILVPSIITLGITVLRLVGELQHWPTVLFNTSAGGGGAIVGIAWLPFIFGPYFAVKLDHAGAEHSSGKKLIGFAILAIVLFMGGSFFAFAPKPQFPGKMLIGLLIMLAGVAVQFSPWPAVFRTLVAYGFAARVPVAVVMFFAIQGNWGTHYDALPPGYTGPTSLLAKWLYVGVLPQLVFWVIYTVLLGSLLGIVVAAVARFQASPPPQSA